VAFVKLSGSLLASYAPSVPAPAEDTSAPRIVPGPAPAPRRGVPANEAGGGQDTLGPAEVAQIYDGLRDCIAGNDQGGVSRAFAHLVSARQPISEIAAIVEALSKARAEEDIQTSELAEPAITAESLDEIVTAVALAADPETEGVLPVPWPEPVAFLEAADRHSARAAEPALSSHIQEDDPGGAHSETDGTDVFPQEYPEQSTVAEGWPTAEGKSHSRPGNTQYETIGTETSGADDNSWVAPAISAARRSQAPFMSKGRLGTALVATAALVGTGLFFVVSPTAKDGAVLAAHSPTGAAANSSPSAVAAATPGPVPVAPGAAVEKTSPAAAALSISAPDTPSASSSPAVPDLHPAEPPPAKPAATASEPPEKANPIAAAAPEGSAPGARSASADADKKAPAIVASVPDGFGLAAPLLPNASAVATGPATDRPEATATVASLQPGREPGPTALSSPLTKSDFVDSV